MVGEEICGAVVSIRFQEDILSIWNRTSNDPTTTSRIRDTLRRVLNLPTNTIMEYKTHNDSLSGREEGEEERKREGQEERRKERRGREKDKWMGREKDRRRGRRAGGQEERSEWLRCLGLPSPVSFQKDKDPKLAM
ncbi:Eukaryotic translation initiation factor 4E type 2 [Liparis tanakae]|uniref:Eukaryotic translation initiation factor 4E type 2 n=1 Tax=Liparis tanakae TaxID=230148 RepID=A0A4Z2E8E9_9TELE|nr:Eukaryotic translation initiation factor 4E type 2 [Liparis tanakae]